MGAQTGSFFWGASEGGNLPDSPQGDKPKDTLPFVLFSVASETFAVEIGRVREIIRIPKVTWVPGAPGLIRGVINLRGNVVAVLDLAAVLSLPPSDETPDSRIIIAETGDQVAGMLVDSVSRVADISPSQVEPALRTLDESQRKFVVAQSNLDEILVGILDLEQIMEQVRNLKTEK